jgi:transcription initiation factor TFIIB
MQTTPTPKTKAQSQQQQQEITSICPTCKNDSIAITDIESGEIICNKCGIVISEQIEETSQEWHIFSAEEINSKTRTGAPNSLARHDRGLYTVIGQTDKDASGNKIDSVMRSRIQRIRRWDYRTQFVTAQDRSLRQAFVELDVLKDKLQLTNAVVEKTAYLYRKAQQKKLIRGRTVSGILSAAVYVACREIEAPRTLKEIASATNNKVKEISRDYRLLYFKLDLKIPNVDPMKCISKIASKVGLSEITKHHAAKILSNIIAQENSAGKDPMGLAATVLYLAGMKNGENVTQALIAKAAGVTEVTLRNTVKDLKKSSCGRNLLLN